MKKKHHQNGIIFIQALLYVTLGSLCAQDLPEVIPPTPMARAIHKYGNYPTDHTTGAISMTIPIYTIKIGNYSLPIELKYHASGIKPTDINGPVGVGWTLHAGGRISQTIRGNNDFFKDKIPEGTVISKPLDGSGYTLLQNAAKIQGGQYDPQFDTFAMSIPGANNNFVLRKEADGSYSAKWFSYENHKLETIHDGSAITSSSPYYFKLTDDRGIGYLFGKKPDSNERVYDYNSTVHDVASPSPRYSQTSSQSNLLTRISFPNTWETIDFEYGQELNGTLEVPFDKEEHYTDQYGPSYPTYTEGNVIIPNPCYDAEFSPITNNTYKRSNSYSWQHHYSKLITKITTGNTEVTFEYTSTGELSFVKIYDITDELNPVLKQQVELELINDGDYRLLSKVSYQNEQGNKENFYKLEYNGRRGMSPNTRGIDYWGYYNGNGNTTLIPYWGLSPNNEPIGGADRSPNEYYMKALSIKKMVLPTGGWTNFEYEPHADQIGTIGGLRIKTYKNFDKTGILMLQKSYKYQPGYVLIRPSEETFSNEYYDMKVGQSCPYIQPVPVGFVYATRRKQVYSGSFTLDSNLGSPVLYKTVTEYDGILTQHNGYTIYTYNLKLPGQQYNNDANSVLDHAFSFSTISQTSSTDNYNPFTEYHSWKSGRLESSITRDKNDNPVRKVSYTYNEYPKEMLSSLVVRPYLNLIGDSSLILGSMLFLDNVNGFSGFYDPFKYYWETFTTGAKKPKTVTTTTYSSDVSGSSVSNVETYSYDDLAHLYPSSMTTSGSATGKEITSSYRYAFDSGLVTSQPLLDTLVQQNNIADPLETVLSVGGIQVSETHNIYRDWDPGLGNRILPEKVEVSKDSLPFEDRIIYENYDDRGNPLQLKKADGIPMSYIWGYGEQYPVAKVENATYTQAIATLTTTELTAIKEGTYNDANMRDKLNKIRTGLPEAQVTTYTYAPLVGITSMTDPRGYTIYYSYDSFNRLKEVRDEDNNLVTDYDYHYRDNE